MNFPGTISAAGIDVGAELMWYFASPHPTYRALLASRCLHLHPPQLFSAFTYSRRSASILYNYPVVHFFIHSHSFAQRTPDIFIPPATLCPPQSSDDFLEFDLRPQSLATDQ